MNLSGTAIPATSLRIDSFGAALRGAIARLRWPAVATAFMIAVAVNTWSTLELVFPVRNSFAQGVVSNAIINLAMAFCIMFTTLVADQLVASGARRFATYGWGVVAGAAIGALAQWQLHQWLGVPYSDDVPGVPHERLVMRPAFIFFEYLIWGSIIVFIYVNRRNALFAAAELNAARVRRTEAQRRTLESRLKALQARVEPQLLFDALAKVRDLYEYDPGRGSAVLGDLIVYLRTALPQLRESTSTLGHEIDLVIAYRNVMRTHVGSEAGIEIDAPDTLRAARMPPMALLPVVNRILVGAPAARIRIAARRAEGALCLAIQYGDAMLDDCDALRDVERRLHALYGASGTLEIRPSRTGQQALMRVPYESTDSRYR